MSSSPAALACTLYSVPAPLRPCSPGGEILPFLSGTHDDDRAAQSSRLFRWVTAFKARNKTRQARELSDVDFKKHMADPTS